MEKLSESSSCWAILTRKVFQFLTILLNWKISYGFWKKRHLRGDIFETGKIQLKFPRIFYSSKIWVKFFWFGENSYKNPPFSWAGADELVCENQSGEETQFQGRDFQNSLERGSKKK